MFCGHVSPLLAACALPLLAPVLGSGRDYCRSPLPCTGIRRGNPPGPPAREQGGRRATSRIASARPAPSLLPRSRPAPPGGLPFYRIRAPCRVAVAPIAAPSYSARGSYAAKPPPAPRPLGRSRPPPKGAPHFELILDMVDILLIFH